MWLLQLASSQLVQHTAGVQVHLQQQQEAAAAAAAAAAAERT
jgi:hypothetical protein